MTRLISLFLLLLHNYGAETRSCYEGFLDPLKSMNIGQNWGHDLPAGTVHIDLHSVTRPYSAFELRTFDPEGVLIFGDSEGGRDWFLLGLRDGRPEIQIHNQLAKVTISGGPRINDGAWHKVIVRSEDHRIVLEVDGEQSLRIGHVTERVTQNLYTVMRISVGGILINQTELLEPINSAMDGCIRNWVWLSLTPEWSQKHHPSKFCFTSHRRGSYFSGSGKALYRTRDLGSLASEGLSWSLKIEFGLHSASTSFTLLSVLDPTRGPVLTLGRRVKNFVLDLGNTTSISSPFPVAQNCDWTYVTLEVTDTGVTLLVGGNKVHSIISETEYNALSEAWQGEAKLLIGTDQYDADHFHGCLQDFRIQGEVLDLDFALFRSDSIWPHSCPLSPSES